MDWREATPEQVRQEVEELWRTAYAPPPRRWPRRAPEWMYATTYLTTLKPEEYD